MSECLSLYCHVVVVVVVVVVVDVVTREHIDPTKVLDRNRASIDFFLSSRGGDTKGREKLTSMFSPMRGKNTSFPGMNNFIAKSCILGQLMSLDRCDRLLVNDGKRSAYGKMRRPWTATTASASAAATSTSFFRTRLKIAAPTFYKKFG